MDCAHALGHTSLLSDGCVSTTAVEIVVMVAPWLGTAESQRTSCMGMGNIQIFFGLSALRAHATGGGGGGGGV